MDPRLGRLLTVGKVGKGRWMEITDRQTDRHRKRQREGRKERRRNKEIQRWR